MVSRLIFWLLLGSVFCVIFINAYRRAAEEDDLEEFIRNDPKFVMVGDDIKERACESLLMCIVTTLNQGLRNGGGIGDILRQPSSEVRNLIYYRAQI